ncbi:Asp-tRNA(Asn)/Glu-tRNA(Gln) amidotransferase subunit GatB [Myxococcota bacterium]|nr:Asp-tRNA(Asn)/Glu-tRNA(Gln) amidotransferase subunit GatB [Myxococcota bacterium]
MSGDDEARIGLEVHVRLATQRKLFCACQIDDDAPPNVHICPTCAGHPGALPWLNPEVIEPALKALKILGSAPQALSRFERKHYLSPDLPKGFQITQRRAPLGLGGRWGGVDIERVQLEEDAGRLIYAPQRARIDLNRAGAPLLEIVTRPDLRDAEAAMAWARGLRAELVWAGLTEGVMAQGHLRFDVNISTGPVGAPLGSRVELKNLNSFKIAVAATRAEIQRQRAARRAGQEIQRETRRWVDKRTEATRAKEREADYRYLIEPNIPPLRLSAETHRALEAWVFEPRQARLRALKAEGLSEAEAEALCACRAWADYYASARAACPHAVALARWTLNALMGARLKPALAPPPGVFGAYVRAIIDEGLDRGAAKARLSAALKDQLDLEAALAALRRPALDDQALGAALAAAARRHPEAWRRLCAGQDSLKRFFMGRVRSTLPDRVDPQRLEQMILEQITNDRSRDEL